jgi:glycosyltransferase involved in cell wall biosynthesis
MLQEVKSRNLSNLYLPGRFPEEFIPGFMQKASVLLATLADREIFSATVPNKIQAYMASGRPIISCLNGEGSRLVLESGAGLVAPAEDASALANAVFKLYGMSVSERQYMGNQGRIYFQTHFDHDYLVMQLIDIFADLLHQSDKAQ